MIVRHPETHANVERRLVGREDSPLTDDGLLQSQRIKDAICSFRPDVVWCSPLRRARAVADAVATAMPVEVIDDERLMEIDFGAAEGLTVDEAKDAGIILNYSDDAAPVAIDGESREQVQKRVHRCLGDVTAHGGRAAIVTHGGIVRAAMVDLLQMSPASLWSFAVPNGCIAVFDVYDDTFVLRSFGPA